VGGERFTSRFWITPVPGLLADNPTDHYPAVHDRGSDSFSERLASTHSAPAPPHPPVTYCFMRARHLADLAIAPGEQTRPAICVCQPELDRATSMSCHSVELLSLVGLFTVTINTPYFFSAATWWGGVLGGSLSHKPNDFLFADPSTPKQSPRDDLSFPPDPCRAASSRIRKRTDLLQLVRRHHTYCLARCSSGSTRRGHPRWT